MCLYTPTKHLLCDCTTFELPSPNPCRLAIRNCTPCTYQIPSSIHFQLASLRLDSPRHTSAPSELALVLPSGIRLPIHPKGKEEGHKRSTKSSPQSAAAEEIPERESQHSIESDNPAKMIRSLTMCPFCLEDKEEREFAKKEKWGLGKKIMKQRSINRKRKRVVEEISDLIDAAFRAEEPAESVARKRQKLEDLIHDRLPKGTSVFRI